MHKQDSRLGTAVWRAWKKWHTDIKDTVPDFGFKEWLQRVGGFKVSNDLDNNVKYEILDEQKVAWFLLKWG